MRGTSLLVLQQRDREFLRELATLRVIDHEQAKSVAGFGSTSRANKRLLKLTRAGLLHRFFLGSGGGRKALYSLSQKGAHLVGVPFRGIHRPQGAVLVADFFLEHQLQLNSVLIPLKFGKIPQHGVTLHRSMTFSEPVTPELRLIPDGYVEFVSPVGIVAAFIEIDLGNEGLKVWREKTRKYLDLAISGTFRSIFGRDRFRVLVIANSMRRTESLRKAIAAVTDKIFRFASIEDARTRFFEPVWRKPTSDKPERLIEESL
jgi:hypothetical protein